VEIISIKNEREHQRCSRKKLVTSIGLGDALFFHLVWLASLSPLLNRDTELLLKMCTMDGIHGTEGDDSAIGHAVVDITVLNPLQVDIVRILEMHHANHDDTLHELRE